MLLASNLAALHVTVVCREMFFLFLVLIYYSYYSELGVYHVFSKSDYSLT